ncbi:hypothetical protein PG991_000497 [Apiospora marii]|uniref:RelA/SpoT domain-containing protein n=1 Tax=Apiospora marii TaxID=335849 RepID=A0ABR1T299_9PEZI
MDVVNSFMATYEQELGQWEQLKNCAIGICMDGLKQIGILGLVTGRVKSVKSLRKKLENRHSIKAYHDEESIMQDQLDFVGLRIALYFPQQKRQLTEMISQEFDHKAVRPFDRDWKPDDPGIYQNLFGQYVADHVWACLRQGDQPMGGVYAKHKFEIQLRSVLMDAWAGISHDLEYKALSGAPSITELKLLDALKGHVEVGEMMLEQLYVVHRKRVEKEDQPIPDSRELGEILLDSLPESQVSDVELGDLEALLTVLRWTENDRPRRVRDLLRAHESQKKLHDDLRSFRCDFEPLPSTVAYCLLNKVLPDLKQQADQFQELIIQARILHRGEWYDSPYWQPLLWISLKLVPASEPWQSPLTEAQTRIYVQIWCSEFSDLSPRHAPYNPECLVECLRQPKNQSAPGMEMLATLCVLSLGPEAPGYAKKHDECEFNDDRFELAANAMCTTYAKHPSAWTGAIHDYAKTRCTQGATNTDNFLRCADTALWLASHEETTLLANFLKNWPMQGQPLRQSHCLDSILRCAESHRDWKFVDLLNEKVEGFHILTE